MPAADDADAPPCSTTKARVRSPAGTWKSSGLDRPRTKRVVVNVGCPPMGVAEQPTGDVDALAPGVGLLVLSLPPQAESRRDQERGAAQRATTRFLLMREIPGEGEIDQLRPVALARIQSGPTSRWARLR